MSLLICIKLSSKSQLGLSKRGNDVEMMRHMLKRGNGTFSFNYKISIEFYDYFMAATFKVIIGDELKNVIPNGTFMRAST